MIVAKLDWQAAIVASTNESTLMNTKSWLMYSHGVRCIDLFTEKVLFDDMTKWMRFAKKYPKLIISSHMVPDYAIYLNNKYNFLGLGMRWYPDVLSLGGTIFTDRGTGDVLLFETESDRLAFMLKWPEVCVDVL